MLTKGDSQDVVLLSSGNESFDSVMTSAESQCKLRRYRMFVWVAFFFFIASVVFAALSAFGIAPFISSPGDRSDEYRLGITPAGFTFSIWSLIYISLALSHIYLIVLAWRHPLIANFVVSTSSLCLLLITYSGQVAWLILFDRELIGISAIVLVITAVAAVIPVHNIAETISYLDSEKWPIRRRWAILTTLMLNAFGIYATWVSIASILNIGIAFQYDGGMDAKFVDLFCLVLVLTVTTMFSLRVFCGEIRPGEFFSMLRLLTPPLVAIWALVGSLVGNDLPIPGTLSTLVFVTMGIQGFTFLVQLLAIACKPCMNRKRSPAKSSSRLGASDDLLGLTAV